MIYGRPVAPLLGAPGTRPTSSLGPVVYELEVRGVLVIADRPEAFAAALASALRARPRARGVGPYRLLAPLGEVTSGQCEVPVYELEMVESSRA